MKVGYKFSNDISWNLSGYSMMFKHFNFFKYSGSVGRESPINLYHKRYKHKSTYYSPISVKIINRSRSSTVRRLRVCFLKVNQIVFSDAFHGEFNFFLIYLTPINDGPSSWYHFSSLPILIIIYLQLTIIKTFFQKSLIVYCGSIFPKSRFIHLYYN